MRVAKQFCNRSFTLKTYTPKPYEWTPPCCNVTKNITNNGSNSSQYFCTATGGSQGQDWTTSYCYNMVVTNFQQEHLAYVECDYVN